MDNIKKSNFKSFFLGLGPSDAKTNAVSLTELSALISTMGEFYQDNDIVWVTSEKAFYTVKKDADPPYEIFTTGTIDDDTGEPTVAVNVTIYYGKESLILAFIRGDQSKAPSILGYKHGDGFISSRQVTAGSTTIEQFDVYEAYVPETPSALDPESYLYIGTIQGRDGVDGDNGATGNQGERGPQGERGNPFTVDEQGKLADRDVDCDTRPTGFSYLATDTGELYFKESDIGITPCVWGDPIPFGKGEPGETTYSVFKRALESDPPEAPTTGTLHPATNQGWSDGPPATANPAYRLWMSKAMYSNSTSGANIIWSAPIMMDGENGLDGKEGVDGKNSGFWVIWSDKEAPNKTGVAKPIIDGNGVYSIDLSGSPDWYDDVESDDSPVWMAQVLYNPNTNAWAEWQFSRIAGEKPPYMIDLYKRSATQPSNVTSEIPYDVNGVYSTGTSAALIVGNGWTDGPSATGEALWMTKLYLNKDAQNNDWSTPVKIDGDEGKQAGIWVVWNPSPIVAKPSVPQDCNLIDDGDTIDLSGSPGWKDDVDELTGEAIWSATSYYKPVGGSESAWTPWNLAQIKGADGLNADQLKTYIEFELASTSSIDPQTGKKAIKGFSDIESALSYIDDENNQLYNVTTAFHDGGDGSNIPPPTVGNKLFKDDEGDIPFWSGSERYYILTQFDEVGASYHEAINYIKVNQSGFITAIYGLQEALATLPATITSAVDIDVNDFYEENYSFTVPTPFPVKFVQAFLYCKKTVVIDYRTYAAGSWTTIPFQHNSEDNSVRGVQLTWTETNNISYFKYTNTTFKVHREDPRSAHNVPTWITDSHYSYFKVVIRVFY